VQKKISSTRIAEGSVRHCLRIESDPCAKGTQQSTVVLLGLLQNFAQVPDLLSCGLTTPETIRIWQTGNGWVVEAEVIITEH